MLFHLSLPVSHMKQWSKRGCPFVHSAFRRNGKRRALEVSGDEIVERKRKGENKGNVGRWKGVDSLIIARKSHCLGSFCHG